MDDIDMSTIYQLRHILGIAGEMVDDICDKKSGNNKNAKDQPANLPNQTTTAGTAGSKTSRKRRFVVPAGAPGMEASTLCVTRQANGSAVVRIDRGSEFTLSTTLTELLLVLAAAGGHSDDALVGWKSLDEISRRLSLKQAKSVSREAVTQNIYRLRIALDKHAAGEWRFVETSAEEGARFALRR